MTLKVYRTPIGFHDAYVAAPSQKAALEAWGAGANLFARGAAEIVTDPTLTAEPLAKPGLVVKRLRGTEAEQIAALPPDPKRTPVPAGRKREKKAPPAPRPSRDALDTAERALADARTKHAAEADALAARRAALDEEERLLRHRQEEEREALEHRWEEASAAYDRALARWRG